MTENLQALTDPEIAALLRQCDQLDVAQLNDEHRYAWEMALGGLVAYSIDPSEYVGVVHTGMREIYEVLVERISHTISAYEAWLDLRRIVVLLEHQLARIEHLATDVFPERADVWFGKDRHALATLLERARLSAERRRRTYLAHRDLTTATDHTQDVRMFTQALPVQEPRAIAWGAYTFHFHAHGVIVDSPSLPNQSHVTTERFGPDAARLARFLTHGAVWDGEA